MTRTDIRDLLEEAYGGPAWHGPHLLSALEGVPLALATRRPGRGRPSIWHLMLHCAYWKHRVRMRIIGGRERFARGGNFPAPPRRPTPAAWRDDREILDAEHTALLGVLNELSPRALERPAKGHRQTPREMLVGVALHDTYHAGQIRLIRMQGR